MLLKNLTNLGLGEKEAKTYLALLELEVGIKNKGNKGIKVSGTFKYGNM